jgi:hypothetical protein
MYKLKSTIKCPDEKKQEIIEQIEKLNIPDYKVFQVDYETFIQESRLYWDFVFPEMLEAHKSVTYITFEFDDTPQGREQCHQAEWAIGWIPQNIRYIEVE